MRYCFYFVFLFAIFFPGLPVLAAIPLTSNTEAECSSEGGTCSINDANCYRLNTSTTAPRYDPIGYCDGAARRNACCKVGAIAADPTPTPATTPISTFNYTLLEEIPGTPGVSGDFASYLQSLYRFTFFGIGIAALFMLTVGGFMYVTSAGNTSRVETAKTIITDSFLGILIALFAWLFLYVINPDLVERMPVAGGPLSTGTIGGGGGTTTPTPTPGGGTGTCQAATAGNCAVSTLQSSCWGARNLATAASKACLKESSGNAGIVSGTDRCVDGTGFSVGLFQINLIANGWRLGAECRGENIFSLADGSPMPTSGPNSTGNNGGRTNPPVPNPIAPAFPAWNCRVKNMALYNQCLARLTDTARNTELGCIIYDAQGWGAWPYTNRICGGLSN